NTKVRRPTIVVTNIKSKELKSATAVIKLLGLKNSNVLSRKVLSHTFSGNFSTLFVHFAVDINDQLAHNFNNSKNVQIEQQRQPKNCKAAKIENEIKETLEDYGYQIQEVKRFHKMPIVKVMFPIQVKKKKKCDLQIRS
ncbi:hypothetical protein RFI_34931, partial [Reticulomyxa filosa]